MTADTPVTPDLTAEVAKVLAAHRQASGFDEVGDYFKYACTCSWSGHSDADHRDHVAAEVTNAVVTALGRPEVVEAVAVAVAEWLSRDGDTNDAHRDAARAALAAIPEALGAGADLADARRHRREVQTALDTYMDKVARVEALADHLGGWVHDSITAALAGPDAPATDERTPREVDRG